MVIRDHFQTVHDVDPTPGGDHDGAVDARVQVVRQVLKLLSVQLMQRQIGGILILKDIKIKTLTFLINFPCRSTLRCTQNLTDLYVSHILGIK